MKKQFIFVGMAVLFLALVFSGCMGGRMIRAYKIDEATAHQSAKVILNMTEQEMNKFPHLKEAIKSLNNSIETPYEEFESLHKLLYLDKYEGIIQYQNEYYMIRLTSP
ncbi:MAG: hypothetical protein ACQXXD_06810 [Thermoplasmatota archaeon]|jgi:hypothetical protein